MHSAYDRPTTLFYVEFKEDDFERLRVILKGIKGRFILSLNDHPGVQKLFADFRQIKVQVKYSAGTIGRLQGIAVSFKTNS